MEGGAPVMATPKKTLWGRRHVPGDACSPPRSTWPSPEGPEGRHRSCADRPPSASAPRWVRRLPPSAQGRLSACSSSNEALKVLEEVVELKPGQDPGTVSVGRRRSSSRNEGCGAKAQRDERRKQSSAEAASLRKRREKERRSSLRQLLLRLAPPGSAFAKPRGAWPSSGPLASPRSKVEVVEQRCPAPIPVGVPVSGARVPDRVVQLPLILCSSAQLGNTKRQHRHQRRVMSVAAKKAEWNACLAKSGGFPGKCEKLEKDLRGASKAEGVDSCVDETIALMRCTTSGARSKGCAAQFLAMRECNRSGGRNLLPEGGGYAVAPGKASLFMAQAGSLTQSAPPTRSLEGMQDAPRALALHAGAEAVLGAPVVPVAERLSKKFLKAWAQNPPPRPEPDAWPPAGKSTNCHAPGWHREVHRTRGAEHLAELRAAELTQRVYGERPPWRAIPEESAEEHAVSDETLRFVRLFLSRARGQGAHRMPKLLEDLRRAADPRSGQLSQENFCKFAMAEASFV
eukprot:g19104.t1